MPFPSLSAAELHESTETAQRFLASAYDSVDGVLESFEIIRTLRREEGQDLRGRLTSYEEDLLRAAIVFAGAGLDATLKQLIRDALPAVVERVEPAERRLEEFARRRLSVREGADPAAIAHYLVAQNPRSALIEDYIADLTGGSLQSQEEVQRVVAAFGIGDRQLFQRIVGLRPAFEARNQVSHERNATAIAIAGQDGLERRIPKLTTFWKSHS